MTLVVIHGLKNINQRV